MAIDLKLPFVPLQIAVLTLSDTRQLCDDKSGDILVKRVQDAGHILSKRAILSDDYKKIVGQLNGWIQDAEVQVILTTGGTGVSVRDVTPEAVRAVGAKEISGFGELFRMLSYEKIGTSAVQSRALAVVANKRLIFALPGSPGACKDAWDGILVSQLDSRHRPCNFSELLVKL